MKALRARRGGLVDYVLRVYRYHARTWTSTRPIAPSA